jgi:hypothetical protein
MEQVYFESQITDSKSNTTKNNSSVGLDSPGIKKSLNMFDSKRTLALNRFISSETSSPLMEASSPKNKGAWTENLAKGFSIKPTKVKEREIVGTTKNQTYGLDRKKSKSASKIVDFISVENDSDVRLMSPLKSKRASIIGGSPEQFASMQRKKKIKSAHIIEKQIEKQEFDSGEENSSD